VGSLVGDLSEAWKKANNTKTEEETGEEDLRIVIDVVAIHCRIGKKMYSFPLSG